MRPRFREQAGVFLILEAESRMRKLVSGELSSLSNRVPAVRQLDAAGFCQPILVKPEM